MKTWGAQQNFEPQRAWLGIAATKFYHRGTEVWSNGKSPSLCVSSGAGGEKPANITKNRQIVVQRAAEIKPWRTLLSPARRLVIIRNLFFAATAALLLTGCSYPDPAKVEQKDSRPAIGISGAPAGTLLFVDGLQMGPVSDPDGKMVVILVESGQHLVEARTPGGEVLMSQELFLSSSTTKIIAYKP